MRRFKLLIDLPFLKKGTVYWFDEETGKIHWENGGKDNFSDYPLREGLAGYLWMLRTETKYLKELK